MIKSALLYHRVIDPTPKVVAQMTTPSNGADILAGYAGAEKDYTIIEAGNGVPTVAPKSVTITLYKQALFVQETILVDTTDSATFWADIQNWLFAYNSFDIQIVGSNYEIQDPSNTTYVILS